MASAEKVIITIWADPGRHPVIAVGGRSMIAVRRQSRRRNQLLQGYLEKVSWKVLNEYSDVIQKMFRRRSGIYALYKKQDRLYYVGLT